MERIVVGVDGSDGANSALRWAARAAAVRDVPLVAVLAWGFLDQKHARPDAPFDPAYGTDAADATLTSILEATLDPDQLRRTERAVVNDLAADALLATATADDLLVVGARGLGGFSGLLLGSVSTKVLGGAQGAVAVVREGGTESGPVVVGVDGSEGSAKAVAWAIEAASAAGVDVRAVHAWSPPLVGGAPFGAVSFDLNLIEDGARELLAHALAEVDTQGVTVHQVVESGSGAAALIGEAAGASLVVVGSRGRTGLVRWILGSVSHQVVQHASGTVVVVPTR